MLLDSLLYYCDASFDYCEFIAQAVESNSGEGENLAILVIAVLEEVRATLSLFQVLSGLSDGISQSMLDPFWSETHLRMDPSFGNAATLTCSVCFESSPYLPQ